MSGNNKTYGLIVPKKGALQPRHSVFGDDSSDETGSGGQMAPYLQTRKAKPVPELDGELLRYDDYHDELQRERAEQQKTRKEAQQARYIPLLMQHAERRKKESERRAERLVHKEREAEGNQFQDKETFVTASYRKKVEEFAQMDAEDRRQDRIDELGDVTKQKDLSAFYGSLYKQTVDVVETKVKVELDDDENSSIISKDEKLSSKKSRHYRKRKNSSSSEGLSEEVNGKIKEFKTHGHKTRDESEGSQSQTLSRRRDGEHSKSSSKRKTLQEAGKSRVEDDTAISQCENDDGRSYKDDKLKEFVESGSEEGEIREDQVGKNEEISEGEAKTEIPVEESAGPAENVVLPPVVEKVDIWEKHTVGEVFEAAVQRYWQRKASRDATRTLAK